jgi:flagellar basal body-associated protein FliL
MVALGCVFFLGACGGGKSGTSSGSGTEGAASQATAGGDKVLNLYIWSDYLAPNALSDFEKQTGIKVHVAYFDTNETLETRLLAGHSGSSRQRPTSNVKSKRVSTCRSTSQNCRISRTWIRSSCHGSRSMIRATPMA